MMFSCRYLYSKNLDFRAAIVELLQSSFSNRVVRIVFFGAPTSNAEYQAQFKAIAEETARKWGDKAPLVSFVAQKPLESAGIVMEIHELGCEYATERKTLDGDTYLLLQRGQEKHLLLGGMVHADLSAPIAEQSDAVFARIARIMAVEGFPVESIVRQWNYIERITACGNGLQHYQDFNDSRSRFYAQAGSWNGGYPAATGIGTQFGGVMIDLQASLGVEVHSIDNPLQISAHAYSKSVLIGNATQKSTPKFERAKAIDADGGLVFISGTAAIRGEKTLEVSIEDQTVATLENIAYLISDRNLEDYGVSDIRQAHLQNIRIYLKQADMLAAVQHIMAEKYPLVPKIYLLAGVCRDNLLIEIEGLANS